MFCFVLFTIPNTESNSGNYQVVICLKFTLTHSDSLLFNVSKGKSWPSLPDQPCCTKTETSAAAGVLAAVCDTIVRARKAEGFSPPQEVPCEPGREAPTTRGAAGRSEGSPFGFGDREGRSQRRRVRREEETV